MLLKKLGEDALIKALARRFAASKHPRLIKGIGDDASVTRQAGGMALLATTDILIEDTHFRRSYTPPRLLGRKSLSVSLSDIAAMGGTPLFFLVSVALPPDTGKEFLDEIYKGLCHAGRLWGCPLAGGNTAKAVDGIMVSTTVLGEAPEDEVVYRRGAVTGDTVFVTGNLGSSALGLKVLENHGAAALKRGPFKGSATRHLDPQPRLKAGRALAAERLATAMMDVSDGLALDLERLCVESGKAAVVYLSSLPLSGELLEYGKRTGRSPLLDFALTGGEDYELIFTSPEENTRRLSALSKRLSMPFTPIGRIVSRKKAGRAVTVIDGDGRPLDIKRPGFEHF